MKKMYWLAACCLLAVGLTACGDDDEGGGNNDNGLPGTTPPTTGEIGIQHPVTSITGYEDSYFHYENGRLVSGTTDGDQFTITQNPLSVQIVWNSEYENIVENYTNIKVNASGFATSADFSSTETYMDGENTESYTYGGTAQMQYDADGHITQKRVSASEGDGYQYNATITYTWENGNLKRIQVDETVTEEGLTDVYSDVYEYTYADDAAQNLNSGVYLHDMWYFTYDFMWYAGLFGKPTRNIPVAMTNTYNYQFAGEEEPDSYTYTYNITTTYNDDNSVASIEYRQPGSSYSSMSFVYGYGEGTPSTAQAPSLQKNAKEKGARKGFAFRHHRK